MINRGLRTATLTVCLILSSGLTSSARAQPYEKLDQTTTGIHSKKVEFSANPVNYAFAGKPEKPGIMFVHGTPGSWQAFAGYLADPELQNSFFMVSIDRPGWGESSLAVKNQHASPVVSFAYQAAAIKAVISEYPNKRWLIVGHSLGASIAPKVALLAPQKVAGLLLLAGSLQPRLGSARWYNLAANLMVVRWLLPKNLRESNDEIMVLRRELKSMEVELKNRQLNTQVVVIQGMKDRLVSPKNARYVSDNWQRSFRKLRIIELPEAGHFIPWQQTTLVKQTILEFDLNNQNDSSPGI